MKIGFRRVLSGVEGNLSGMLDRSNRIQAYLNRNVYRQYQNAQRKRWMTENASEGERWKPLNEKYAKQKRKKFAAYPGAGTKMLIATGRLSKSVIGPGDDHKKTATSRKLEIAWTTPYASYVDEVRNFTDFGEETMQEIYDGLADFLIQGIWRDIR